MTGGIALPFIIGYGAAAAGIGALLGLLANKNAKKPNNNK